MKVLNSRGSGYASWIVAGIDWIAANGNIEVANMSLGGPGFNQAEYDAIQGAVDAGVALLLRQVMMAMMQIIIVPQHSITY